MKRLPAAAVKGVLVTNTGKVYPSTTPGPATASLRRLPGETPVYLPWAAIHMGDAPGSLQGQTGVTPASRAGGNVITGGQGKLDPRFASIPGSPHCLKNGQNADCQSAVARLRGLNGLRDWLALEVARRNLDWDALWSRN
jgi:hypothetical protein